jgi:hypothetical protein
MDNPSTDAWVYVAKKPKDDPALRPYTWYKRFLVEGAREHSLPEGYIAELDRIDAVADTDECRDREKRARGFALSGIDLSAWYRCVQPNLDHRVAFCTQLALYPYKGLLAFNLPSYGYNLFHDKGQPIFPSTSDRRGLPATEARS